MAHRHSHVSALVVVVCLVVGTLTAHGHPLVDSRKSITVQRIHSLGGRQTSALANKTLPPGIHELACHARNDRRKSLPSSIYA